MSIDTTSILRIRKPQRRLSGRVLRSPAAVLSLVWLVGLVLASLTSPLWLRYGPLEQDLSAVLQGIEPEVRHVRRLRVPEDPEHAALVLEFVKHVRPLSW